MVSAGLLALALSLGQDPFAEFNRAFAAGADCPRLYERPTPQKSRRLKSSSER